MGAKKQFQDDGQIHSVDLACYHAIHAYPGGVNAVAAGFGWKPAVLQNKINPTQTTHKLTAKELEAVLELTRDERILAALGVAGGGVFVPVEKVEPVGDVGVLECGTNLHGGSFHLSKAFVKALEDGVIDGPESENLKREAYELQKRIAELLLVADQFRKD
ncbi:phage regulatory CII family protein [Aliamphritea hakodatensis]|uniref:phage regulatory CII family protein n=1 Tax=Aliamphritea hakodatensis TaxID=2895352 RepID=UPI0022FDA9E1|nr:phage regulatory CII family protein [Aliamphritea hakodatensis]